MKRTLLFLCLAVALFQSGCAIPPPIEQQTLEQQKQAQAEKKSDAFARGLPQ
jgi:starvation-inducible outer membrane lipoprotein